MPIDAEDHPVAIPVGQQDDKAHRDAQRAPMEWEGKCRVRLERLDEAPNSPVQWA